MTASKDLNFSKSFEELEKITQSFEKGAFDLDEGLKQFERGLELAGLLKKKLADVENKVEVIKKKFGQVAPARQSLGEGGDDADGTLSF